MEIRRFNLGRPGAQVPEVNHAEDRRSPNVERQGCSVRARRVRPHRKESPTYPGRSRLSEKVFQRAVEAIDAHPDFLEQVFKASPTTFALIMVKLMPREHQITHQSRLSDMTDAQLEQALSYGRNSLAVPGSIRN